jgi:hypothetical protein
MPERNVRECLKLLEQWSILRSILQGFEQKRPTTHLPRRSYVPQIEQIQVIQYQHASSLKSVSHALQSILPLGSDL